VAGLGIIENNKFSSQKDQTGTAAIHMLTRLLQIDPFNKEIREKLDWITHFHFSWQKLFPESNPGNHTHILADLRSDNNDLISTEPGFDRAYLPGYMDYYFRLVPERHYVYEIEPFFVPPSAEVTVNAQTLLFPSWKPGELPESNYNRIRATNKPFLLYANVNAQTHLVSSSLLTGESFTVPLASGKGTLFFNSPEMPLTHILHLFAFLI